MNNGSVIRKMRKPRVRERQPCGSSGTSRAETCNGFARFARRNGCGDDFSMCAPCSRNAKGKETPFQAHRVSYVKRYRTQKTKLPHVSSLPHSAETHEHFVAKAGMMQEKHSGNTVNEMEIRSDSEGAGQGEPVEGQDEEFDAGDGPGDSESTKKTKVGFFEKGGGLYRMTIADRMAISRNVVMRKSAGGNCMTVGKVLSVDPHPDEADDDNEKKSGESGDEEKEEEVTQSPNNA